MAECFACKKALQGSWNMTVHTTYDKTGRYLGIGDGYFLHSGSPNWVYCYCQPCWQNAVLNLSFVPKSEQLNTLQQQITSFQQQLGVLQQQLKASQQNHANVQQQLTTVQQQNTSLQQQLNASQQNHVNLQQQLNTSQDQLASAQIESVSYKKQLDEISEKYQKLSNTSGIEKLRDLFKQLTSSQSDILHKQTNFRVDTFETVHGEQQLQCSTQFVRSILTQLKSSVDAVVQLQKIILTQRQRAKESVFQTLTTAGVSQTIIDASIKPLETEIEQIGMGIKGWNEFSTILVNTINQTSPTSTKATELVTEAKDTVDEVVSSC